VSRVYFHSPSGEVEVRGAERAHMGMLCTDLAIAAFGGWREWADDPHWIRAALPPECYAAREPVGSPYFGERVRTYLSIGLSGDGAILHNGKRVPGFDLILNTALVLGSDPIKLCARIHGQCEIHAWVAGPNRRWLAGIVRDGRQRNVLRANMGWEGAADFLEALDSEPAVLSYSVCEQFPGSFVLPADHPARANDGDGWYALSGEEKWRLGIAWLPDNAPELTPDDWTGYHFTDGVTVFDVRAAADEQHIAARGAQA